LQLSASDQHIFELKQQLGLRDHNVILQAHLKLRWLPIRAESSTNCTYWCMNHTAADHRTSATLSQNLNLC